MIWGYHYFWKHPFKVFVVGDFPAIHHVSSHQPRAEAYLGSIKQRLLVQRKSSKPSEDRDPPLLDTWLAIGGGVSPIFLECSPRFFWGNDAIGGAYFSNGVG